VQANLISVPKHLAHDARLFARRNPKACPVLDVIESGATGTVLAAEADLRTDVPAYCIWRNGELEAEVDDATAYWRSDLVTFLTGCSFTFESALVEAGVPLRHREMGLNVPMFRTNRSCRTAGKMHGPLVVSMRAVPADLVATAVRVTSCYPLAHGSPVHMGDPAELGIEDVTRPDFGDSVSIGADVPLFWACGVTYQAAVMASRPEFAITHAPGHMFITDVDRKALGPGVDSWPSGANP
jgi:uncharacterized protein YcsI (UPF0317 family)